MEILALILLVGLLFFGYPWYQERRERQLAERLEKMRESCMVSVTVSVEVDAAIAQAKREADLLGSLRYHRF